MKLLLRSSFASTRCLFKTAIAASALLLGNGSASAAMYNGSFELGSDGWTLVGPTTEVATRMAFTIPSAVEGTKVLRVPAVLGSYGGAYQTLPVTPGTEYKFTGYVCNSINWELAPENYGQARIDFMADGSDTPLTSEFSGQFGQPPGPTADTWKPFSMQATAPPGATSARFWVTTMTSPVTDAGGLYYDLIDVAPVPEPSTVFWIGCVVAAVGCDFVRRRRNVASR